MISTWYLFRHALATYSKNGYGDQILTAPILQAEVKPIESMAEYLKNTGNSLNYSSELLRCRQTTEIISGITQKKFLFDKRLNEYYKDSFIGFRDRIANFLKKGIKNTQTANILICTHGSVIAGIKHFITDGDFLEDDLYDYPLCGELIIIKNKQIQQINFNEKKGDL
jgi:broad specificity phosphatase PhoE